MLKKYTYCVDFTNLKESPSGVGRHSATSECSLAEMKDLFHDYCDKHSFETKGGLTSGMLLNAKGEEIGEFKISSKQIL